MPPDQEFLFYPLDTGEHPLCTHCRRPMLLAAREVREGKPDFLTFLCETCGRSEKFVCEDDAADINVPAGQNISETYAQSDDPQHNQAAHLQRNRGEAPLARFASRRTRMSVTSFPIPG